MLVQEIKRERRSLKEILPKRTRQTAVNDSDLSQPVTPPPNHRPSTAGSGAGKWWLLLLLLIIVALGAFVLLQNNAKATVKLTIKHFTATLDDDFEAVRTSNSGATSGLLFEVVVVEKQSESKTVPATGIKQLSQKATGKVVLANKSLTSQKLIATTRLATADGKIYRLREGALIPAAKKVGTQLVSGTVEVGIIADKAGADFNIGPTDFTLPGLKGTPRYQQMSARSKASLIGGVVGAVAQVEAGVEAATRQELRQALGRKLLAVAKEGLPARAWLSPQAVSVEFDPPVPPVLATGEPKQATITESAQLWGIVFDRANLAQQIAKFKAPAAAVGDLALTNIDDLKLDLKNTASLTSDSVRVAFHLTGTANLLPQINPATLQQELAGANKNQIELILQHFPLISGAEVVLRPPWLRQLPGKEGIVVELDPQ